MQPYQITGVTGAFFGNRAVNLLMIKQHFFALVAGKIIC